MSKRERTRFVTTPLFQQVHNHLTAEIAAGIWPVGAMLPNEIELSRSLNVSPGTIRKALDLMEAEFLVERTQGRGTTVKAREPAKECPTCCGTGRIAPEKAA